MNNDKEVVEFLEDDHVDDHVDDEIKDCISLENPKSFFVFAGAGSGKTRSLVNTMTYINETMGKMLSERSKKVAVITYTNAAVDEISSRIQYNPIFSVSTIHSFLWELIKNYQSDIREWLVESLKFRIEKLKNELATARKSNESKEKEIKRRQERLDKISKVKKFLYNPNGDNPGYNSLNHDEVIKMGCEFIENECTIQKIMVSQYPIILIDESQDTKKELVDALKVVIENNKDKFIIGMFGDTMQRIYLDGKDNLAECIPDDWVKPVKVMNHRSAVRIVRLANDIRKTTDGQQQQHRSDAVEGTIRLFVVPNRENKDITEAKIADLMAEETKDEEWKDGSKYKSLILEHHMAASRFGFLDLFLPLNDSKCFDTSLRNGSIPELSFLSNVISPLLSSYRNKNDYEVASIIRKNSPLLERNALMTAQKAQIEILHKAEEAVNSLMSLWNEEKVPACIEILQNIKESGLFKLSPRIEEILTKPSIDESKSVSALRTALSVPFDMLKRYSE